MFILSYIYSTIIILLCQINGKSRFWEFYTVWMHLCLSLRKFNCFVQIRRHIRWKKHKERKIERKGYLLSYHLNHYFCNRRRHIDADVRHKPNRGKSIELQLDNKPCLDIVFISRNSICRRADHFNINPCESVCKTRCFFVFRRHMDKSLCLGQFHHLMQISVSFRPQNQKKRAAFINRFHSPDHGFADVCYDRGHRRLRTKSLKLLPLPAFSNLKTHRRLRAERLKNNLLIGFSCLITAAFCPDFN